MMNGRTFKKPIDKYQDYTTANHYGSNEHQFTQGRINIVFEEKAKDDVR